MMSMTFASKESHVCWFELTFDWRSLRFSSHLYTTVWGWWEGCTFIRLSLEEMEILFSFCYVDSSCFCSHESVTFFLCSCCAIFDYNTGQLQIVGSNSSGICLSLLQSWHVLSRCSCFKLPVYSLVSKIYCPPPSEYLGLGLLFAILIE